MNTWPEDDAKVLRGVCDQWQRTCIDLTARAEKAETRVEELTEAIEWATAECAPDEEGWCECLKALRRRAGLCKQEPAKPEAPCVWRCDTCGNVRRDEPGDYVGMPWVCGKFVGGRTCGGRLTPVRFVPISAG